MVRYLSLQRDKWMKYYFTIVAAGFSYIGFTLKLSYDKALEKDPCLYKRGEKTQSHSLTGRRQEILKGRN